MPVSTVSIDAHLMSDVILAANLLVDCFYTSLHPVNVRNTVIKARGVPLLNLPNLRQTVLDFMVPHEGGDAFENAILCVMRIFVYENFYVHFDEALLQLQIDGHTAPVVPQNHSHCITENSSTFKRASFMVQLRNQRFYVRTIFDTDDIHYEVKHCVVRTTFFSKTMPDTTFTNIDERKIFFITECLLSHRLQSTILKARDGRPPTAPATR